MRIKNSLLTIVLFLFVIGCAKKEPTVVEIGAVLPLTGDVAGYGKDSKDGADLAIELANKSQDKIKLKLLVEDSQGDPKTAVSALQKVLSLGKVPAVIGENISSSTLAMIPVVDQAKVVLISPSASAPKLSGMSKYFFRVFPSDIEEGAFVVEAIAKEKPSGKVCILYVNNDFGLGLKEVFESNAKAKGLKVLESFGYDKTNTDFRTILSRVKELKPDVVYNPGYYQDGGAILKQSKQLGIKASFYGATTFEDPQLLTIAGDAAEGLFYPVSTGFDPNSPDTAVQRFVHDFRTKYSKEPGLLAALGYDCAKLIIDGVLCNGPSSEQIREFISNAKNYSGASGRMTFDEKGDVHKSIRLKTVKNKQFVFAEK